MDHERRNAVRRFLLTLFAKAIGAQVRWFRRLAGDGESAPPWTIEIPAHLDAAAAESEPKA